MLVFDVGANVGDKAAQLRDAGARLVCFEPQPHCAARLRERFAGDPGVAVVEQAVGAGPGTAILSICDAADTVSTMSDRWKTGRFRDLAWTRDVEVAADTLDAAIARFGAPDYCKVDVEGFEIEVLNGLSRPLPLLSFEFTKEFEGNAAECLRRLQQLGFTRFNLCFGETARFALDRWADTDAVVALLARIRHPLAWGDIFAAQAEPEAALLRLARQGGRGEAEETSLGLLHRLGVAYPGLPLRLHLGCGETILPGYVNLDYPPDQHTVMDVRPDVETDILALDFPAGSVDEIRLHHVFEHFNRVVALGLLVRWHGWLKPGGRLVIETPDFMACARAFLEEEPARRIGLVRHLEGDQAAAWAYHVGQWYPERFAHTLSAMGFDEVATETTDTRGWHRPALHNVTARAVKQRTIPQDALITAATRLLWDSTVSDLERPTWEVWCGQLRRFLARTDAPGALIAARALPAAPADVAPDVAELAELRRQVAAAEARHAAVLASTSWRLTAPVRRLKQWIAGS